MKKISIVCMMVIGLAMPGFCSEVAGLPPGQTAEGVPAGGSGDGGEEGTHYGFTFGGVVPRPASEWTNRPPDAVVHERWTRYGIHEDTFYMPTNGWAFPVRGLPVEGLWVTVGGTVMLDRGEGRLARDNMLSVLKGPISIVPSEGSMFWHYVTPTNSLVLTWEHVFLGRDTNYPVTIQAELKEDGSFAYRYTLINPSADYEAALAGFTMGVLYNGEGPEWLFKTPVKEHADSPPCKTTPERMDKPHEKDAL